MNQIVKTGDKVKIHYTGRFENGDVFDSSQGRQPLEFEVGSEELIKGFENAVIGMQTGDQKTITIEPVEAYGEYNDDLVIELPKDAVAEDCSLEVGMVMNLENQDGQEIQVLLKDVKEETVILDANHPLAGKKLIFDLSLEAIN